VLRLSLAFLALSGAAYAAAGRLAADAPRTETLRAIGGLPSHIVARFFEPVAFVETSGGEFLVLDRRRHMVYRVNAAKTHVREVLQIGFDPGTVLQPGALTLTPEDVFAVSDAPGGRERIQYFNLDGLFLGGFYLNTTAVARIVVDALIVNGAGSMHFTGRRFLLNQPESGSLITELNLDGHVVRRYGALRATGHEHDRDLHLAMNVGLPVATPDGGVYFVFRSGVPLIRKYDADGALVFERHIEGPELDRRIQSLPEIWPARPAGESRLPLVPPLVRAAAVDRTGRLWVTLVEPYAYLYDTEGRWTRAVRFQAAGLIPPSSLFFTRRGTVLVTPGCYEFPLPS
jgi:hypothetical protein